MNSFYKPIPFYYETRTCVMPCCPFLLSSSKIVSWSKLQISEWSWHFNELKNKQTTAYECTVTGSLWKALPCPRFQNLLDESRSEKMCNQVSLTRPLPSPPGLACCVWGMMGCRMGSGHLAHSKAAIFLNSISSRAFLAECVSLGSANLGWKLQAL